MANLQIKDAAAAEKYLKSTGAGTDVDPHIPQHLETNSAAIAASVATVAGAVAGTEMQVDVLTMPSVAVTGPLTDAQLRASAVAVGDGNGSLTVDGAVAVSSIAAGTNIIGKILISQPTDFLVAKGTRDATTGDGTLFIAADATKKVEYHLVKIIRVANTGDQTIVLKSGSNVIDNMLMRFDANKDAIIMDYNGKFTGNVNEAQYFNTSTAVTFDYWVLYRLV